MISSDKHRAPRLVAVILLVPLFVAACNTQVPDPTDNNPPGGSQNTGNTGVSGTQNPPPTASGDNTALEQLMMERMNRARLRPATEAARFGIDLNEGVPPSKFISSASKQPLAFNATLTGTARAHSQDMLNNDYFAHNSLNGNTPFERMALAGYDFQTAGENLAWRGTTGTLDEIATANLQHQDLFVDTDYPDRGHRVVMMTAAYKEVGIGVLRGMFTDNDGNPVRTYDSLMTTQDFGTRRSSPSFITGVIYNDANRNGDYDVGEGVANANVFLTGGPTTTTNAGGGYSFAVSPGNYTVAFNSGAQQAVTVGNVNIKVDLIDGTRVLINLGLGPL